MDRKRAGLGLEMGRGIDLGCERRWEGGGVEVAMGAELEEGAKDRNDDTGKTKIAQGPLIDASVMYSCRGHLVIPQLLGMSPAQPHPSQINGCLSTLETTSVVT